MQHLKLIQSFVPQNENDDCRVLCCEISKVKLFNSYFTINIKQKMLVFQFANLQNILLQFLPFFLTMYEWKEQLGIFFFWASFTTIVSKCMQICIIMTLFMVHRVMSSTSIRWRKLINSSWISKMWINWINVCSKK